MSRMKLFLQATSLKKPLSISIFYNKYMSSFALLLVLITTSRAFNATYEQFLNSTPQTFGLLTVTHSRNDDYEYFKQFLERYASMDCPMMTEMSVVWNNDISPEQAGIKISEDWKRPVYYFRTPENSMDFRYMLPRESSAQIFFSIDDDILIDCEELVKGFKVWQKSAVGDIGPLLGYAQRGFDYDSVQGSYKYQNPRSSKIYSINLIGIAWVPRFYFSLYNSDKISQVAEMRNIVRSKNNCDDIALNFIVNHFFPEFVSLSITGNATITEPAGSQINTPNHYKFRTECLSEFMQILGYNPLRLVRTDFRGNFYLKASIYQKRKFLSQNYLENTDLYGTHWLKDKIVRIAQTKKQEKLKGADGVEWRKYGYWLAACGLVAIGIMVKNMPLNAQYNPVISQESESGHFPSRFR